MFELEFHNKIGNHGGILCSFIEYNCRSNELTIHSSEKEFAYYETWDLFSIVHGCKAVINCNEKLISFSIKSK